MVAHMNAEALRLTIETGEVHYYSRSRGKLWKKGETSGEVQKLIGLSVDCDQDTLLLRVEQTGRGAACHTGRKSCFYRVLKDGKLVDTGEPRLFDPEEVYGR
jgi:phosphoribosyl-AMP cyclohydrolase